MRKINFENILIILKKEKQHWAALAEIIVD
jgi:hypothetical protein